ncbi:MAG: sugar transferase [Rubripirellula sp.]|nr:sugar transferase [Rubripirellula sp.]
MHQSASQIHSGEIGHYVTPSEGEKSPEQTPRGTSDSIRDFVADTPDPQVDWLLAISTNPNRGIVEPLPETIQLAKRILDVFAATTGILLLWPLMLLAALAVKFSSPGGAIFSQQRVGLNRRNRDQIDRRNSGPVVDHCDRRQILKRRQECGYGRAFTLYKFRTMVVDAEKNGAQFAVQNDPRVTRLGRFMRKTRIDELPQLWNVLCGDMSLVGPRPERPEFIEELSAKVPNYLDRLQLKPGVTGVAQIENGYDNDIDSFKRKVGYDLLYLRHCCLRNDIKILLRTVHVVLTGKGAL